MEAFINGSKYSNTVEYNLEAKIQSIQELTSKLLQYYPCCLLLLIKILSPSMLDFD